MPVMYRLEFRDPHADAWIVLGTGFRSPNLARSRLTNFKFKRAGLVEMAYRRYGRRNRDIFRVVPES